MLVSDEIHGNGPRFFEERFLRLLAKKYNVLKQEEWHNNNSTLRQRAYVIDLKDFSAGTLDIIRRLFHYNLENQPKKPLVVVPVAGWKTNVNTDGITSFSCFSTEEDKQRRLVAEYAQSFSLSKFTSAPNADIILRKSVSLADIQLEGWGREIFLKVSPGVRITDLDQFLFEKGLALPTNMLTLHVASMVGALSNGCYGPGRDFGPMTTNIVEIKGVDAKGNAITLSATERSDLFYKVRDCSMGAGFVITEITLGNIQQRFQMRRKNVLYQDVAELKEAALQDNPLNQEHFIAMYIPVDIKDKGKHDPRIRITTCERLNGPLSKDVKSQPRVDVGAYFSLMRTEAGEPLIDLISRSEKLRPLFPFVLKLAALETYGTKKETIEVDWSARILHLFKTYTDLPIYDINWLIQVKSIAEAKDLFLELLELVEERLKVYAEKEEYPLFNAFARYLKGLSDPDVKLGVGPTITDSSNHSILSFELITYTPLSETAPFKELVALVVNHLTTKGYKFKYHPGKSHPDNIRSLTQIFTDATNKQRLANFQEAIIDLHGSRQNIAFSPLLTPQKKEYIGFGNAEEGKDKEPIESHHREQCSEEDERQVLKKIYKLAKQHKNDSVKKHIKQALKKSGK